MMKCNVSLLKTIYPRNYLKFITHSSAIKQSVYYSRPSDAYIEYLSLEKHFKEETEFMKYFLNSYPRTLAHSENTQLNNVLEKSSLDSDNVSDIVQSIERCLTKECNFPNSKINFLLLYFAKNGKTNGIKAVQTIIEKYDKSHFKLHSQFIHYAAEAHWVNGKTEDSMKLFSKAYDNKLIQTRVKVMMICLFPDIVIYDSKVTLDTTVCLIEHFSGDKQDFIILAYLWKELFQSSWFADHQLAQDILERNIELLILIQWMIPGIGKNLLKAHKVEDFYRLIEFSLQHDLKKFTETLLRILFDYFYCQENIKRCTSIVKFACELNFKLKEEQHTKYINLLLLGKHSASAKLSINTPQAPKLKF